MSDDYFVSYTAGHGNPLLSPYAPGSSDNDYWAGIKWDLTTHTLYVVATNAGPGDVQTNDGNAACGSGPPLCRTDLFKIDPATGLGIWVAQIDSIANIGTVIADIAIAPNGDMFALNMTDDSFYLIDKTTGHVRPVGPSGLLVGYWPFQSMDFNQATGDLYYTTWPVNGSSAAMMYVVDTHSGAVQPLGPIGPLQGGSSELQGFNIAISGGPCANHTDVPWLSFSANSGSVDPNDTTEVTVTFDANGLAAGTYNAKICVDSNTPFDTIAAVPVTFTVDAGDRIFANGFDAN